MYGAPGAIRTPDRLVRSLNFSLYVIVLFNLLVVMSVAIFTTVHNDA